MQKIYCWKWETEQPLLSRTKKNKLHAPYTDNKRRFSMLRNNTRKIKFFAVSMYLDIEEQIENSYTKMDEILQFAKGARILIATDTIS